MVLYIFVFGELDIKPNKQSAFLGDVLVNGHAFILDDPQVTRFDDILRLGLHKQPPLVHMHKLEFISRQGLYKRYGLTVNQIISRSLPRKVLIFWPLNQHHNHIPRNRVRLQIYFLLTFMAH